MARPSHALRAHTVALFRREPVNGAAKAGAHRDGPPVFGGFDELLAVLVRDFDTSYARFGEQALHGAGFGRRRVQNRRAERQTFGGWGLGKARDSWQATPAAQTVAYLTWGAGRALRQI